MSAKRHNSSSLKVQNAISLLHSSIVKGNKSTFAEALKLGCGLTDISKHGDPPLVAAAGVDPYTAHDSKTGKDKMIGIMEMMIGRPDCDMNIRGVGGETALHRAIFVRSEARVKYLLENGSDPDIRDSRGQTALFGAIGFIEGLHVLLRYKPMLDVYDFEGLTPMMHAMMSESPDTLQTLKMIVEARCDVNVISARDKKTALMVSLREDQTLPRSDQVSDQLLSRTIFTLSILSKESSLNPIHQFSRCTFVYIKRVHCYYTPIQPLCSRSACLLSLLIIVSSLQSNGLYPLRQCTSRYCWR